MNRTKLFSSLITLILFINYSFSQEKPGYVILSGTVKNGNETLELRPIYDIANKSKRRIIHLDENGNFFDTINIEKKELYLISDKTNTLKFYLSPSKKYSIEYDLKEFKNKGVTLKGDDIAINEYFIDKARNQGLSDYNGDGKSEKEFRNSLNRIKEKQLERVNVSKLPSSLKTHESNSIKYEYLGYLDLYIRFNDIDTPSVESQNELNIDYLNEEDYVKHVFYKDLLFSYYRTKLVHNGAAYKKLNPSYSLAQNAIKELASMISNEYIKNDLIIKIAPHYLEESKNIEAYYKDFKKYYTGNDTRIKVKMLDLYTRFGTLKKGTPSPKFTNYKNYNGGVNSLDDFKGKFVFIDIWATWCGNCKNQMPALKKLEEEYKDIVFLNIAWKDDEDKWRKTIRRESLTGVQLFATKKDNAFFEEYGIYGIPKYILIDPKGNIVDHSTPRPSDDKLKILFKSVGIESLL